MNFLRRIAVVSLSLVLIPLLPAAKVKHAKPVEGVYTGAITLDADSGAVLFEENADAENPPASMTKLMTFAVVSDRLAAGTLSLQTMVQVTAEDSKMGGTQVYLDPRESFPVEELIYAMMIQSANDAAHALSRAAAGSTPAFVELMNAKARSLGMTHTTFRTPHGLPPPSRRDADGDLTTPRDFALLCRYLLQKTDVLKYTSVKERDFGASRVSGPQHMHNHNNLLGKIPGVDGLKTGYTKNAGYCLSVTAERNGRRVISVIMGSFGPGRSVDKGRARDLKAVELIEQGFATLPAIATVKTAANPAPAIERAGAPVTNSETIPTVTTDKSNPAPAPTPAPKPADQASTAKEPMFKLQITPPSK